MEIDYAADATMFDDDTAGSPTDGTAPEGTTDGSTEMDAKLRELAMLQLQELRDELVEQFPAIEPLADMLDGQDENAIRALAADLNARLGGEPAEPHPGSDSEERRIAALPGQDSLAKALAHAKQTGETSALMALKRAAAYEAAGLIGRRLDAEQREDIQIALRFARAAQDHAAVQRLMAQLGG